MIVTYDRQNMFVVQATVFLIKWHGNLFQLFPADEPLWPYYSVLTATANFDSDLETAVVQAKISQTFYGRKLRL